MANADSECAERIGVLVDRTISPTTKNESMRKRTKGVAVALANVAVVLFFFLAPIVPFTLPVGCGNGIYFCNLILPPTHGYASVSYALFGVGVIYLPKGSEALYPMMCISFLTHHIEFMYSDVCP